MALAKSQQSLKKWTGEKWKTSDGKPSKGKKRYLPTKAWAALSPAEKVTTPAFKCITDNTFTSPANFSLRL